MSEWISEWRVRSGEKGGLTARGDAVVMDKAPRRADGERAFLALIRANDGNEAEPRIMHAVTTPTDFTMIISGKCDKSYSEEKK